MDEEKKKEIANSFSDEFEEQDLGIKLTKEEFKILEEGIYARDMDEKWNVFTIDSNIYFARSWTGNCIFKVSFEKGDEIHLKKIKVTRDSKKYKGDNLGDDMILFKRLLQMYLGREDLFVDDRLALSGIRKLIGRFDPDNRYKKSIETQTVGLCLSIFGTLQDETNKKYVEVIGLDEFKEKARKFDSGDELLCLHLSERDAPNSRTTFYFNDDATELVGQLTIKIRGTENTASPLLGLR